MKSVFGLVGKDLAVVATDTSAVHSILVHKTNEDKIMLLDSHKLVGASGETGDRLVVAAPNFVINIVDKDGAREYALRKSIKDAAGA